MLENPKNDSKNYAEILTEVTIDNLNFQVTWNPFEKESCVLWFRDTLTNISFTALGKFAGFNKLKVLNFAVKYSVNPDLRKEITNKKFERKISKISLEYFDQIELLSFTNKKAAYSNLFDLDETPAKQELSEKRRMMVKKFHPDAGGDDRAMSIINQAYEYLTNAS